MLIYELFSEVPVALCHLKYRLKGFKFINILNSLIMERIDSFGTSTRYFKQENECDECYLFILDSELSRIAKTVG